MGLAVGSAEDTRLPVKQWQCGLGRLGAWPGVEDTTATSRVSSSEPPLTIRLALRLDTSTRFPVDTVRRQLPMCAALGHGRRRHDRHTVWPSPNERSARNKLGAG